MGTPTFRPCLHRTRALPNEFSKPESLYLLCDYDFLVSKFEKDLVVKFLVGRQTADFDFLREYEEVASAFDVDLSWGTPVEAGRVA